MSKNMRIFFMKKDRAKYISHLDLQRTMQRALKRAKLPVWETEGFNPHIYLTFALPLSLGIESVSESFDVKLIADISPQEICTKLGASLSQDLQVIKAAEPIHKPVEIQKARYEILLSDSEKFNEYLEQDEIIITKKTKKGQAQLDIKPLIELEELEKNKIILRLPAGSGVNLNPLQVLSGFEAFTGAELQTCSIIRTGIFCANGEIFT
ncbi:MAG: TIGR03936 family radical SAM-associated protein [Oscillospiraceae bacterium]|nr:TIGR03936 family radical SAM-associated protein [Oscillospiraceae bacterium]